VDIAAAADVGGGYTIGWADAGEWLGYSVVVDEAGEYNIDVRVASAGPGGTFHIEVDGVDQTGPLLVPDTETAFLDPLRRQTQLSWLEADLASTNQPWRVVYFHRPPYNGGPHHGSDLDIRNAFAPLFERYGAQLVISAHEHVYERSVPWSEFVPDVPGVTYIVSGGGGAPLYENGSGPWTATSASAHHYVRVAVDSCTLRGEAVGLTGSVFDAFEIDRCR
jgi:Calcineurin-like phosphoesterase/Carbohydrate binding module (family 6)